MRGFTTFTFEKEETRINFNTNATFRQESILIQMPHGIEKNKKREN